MSYYEEPIKSFCRGGLSDGLSDGLSGGLSGGLGDGLRSTFSEGSRKTIHWNRSEESRRAALRVCSQRRPHFRGRTVLEKQNLKALVSMSIVHSYLTGSDFNWELQRAITCRQLNLKMAKFTRSELCVLV